MKKIDLGQAIAILANMGVIAGIVFLGIEIRQNNSLLAAQASYSRLSAARERRARLMENRGGILEATLKANVGDDLSTLEAAQVNIQGIDLLDTWQWEYREYRAGRLRMEDMNLANWRGLWEANTPIRDAFEGRRELMDRDFIQFFEQVIGSR